MKMNRSVTIPSQRRSGVPKTVSFIVHVNIMNDVNECVYCSSSELLFCYVQFIHFSLYLHRWGSSFSYAASLHSLFCVSQCVLSARSDLHWEATHPRGPLTARCA